MHLVVRSDAVDLEDAEFLRRSILAHSGSEPAVPERDNPGERPGRKLTTLKQARWTAQEKSFRLARQLADELVLQQGKRTQVVSLRRATTGELVLSGVGLEDCAFAGANSDCKPQCIACIVAKTLTTISKPFLESSNSHMRQPIPNSAPAARRR